MPFSVTSVNHVGLRVLDLERATRYYVDVLGLTPRPEKPNWLLAGNSYCIHLMPSNGGPEPIDFCRHVAFEVADLYATAKHFLTLGLHLYQGDLSGNCRDVTALDDPLDFGIGTLFTEDTEGNTLEFVQFGHGWLYASRSAHFVDPDHDRPGSPG